MERDQNIIEFLRKRDYVLVQELGRGACGRTVLLHDDMIDEYFVCKKYAPIQPELQDVLFRNFVREIKLLHLLNHPNVVRVFNYFLYPSKTTGFILMEYVKGLDVEDFVSVHSDQATSLFEQAIEAFEHLEQCKILHRDIRPKNILVNEDGRLKVIDFGFGKEAVALADFDKSVTLNWWCPPPPEFAHQKYDFRTEIYFAKRERLRHMRRQPLRTRRVLLAPRHLEDSPSTGAEAANGKEALISPSLKYGILS